MRILPRLIAPLLAAGLVLLPVAASAAPGIANVNANVRSGPGLGYRVVDVLEKGEYVIVKDCGANWCLISHIGKDGYVSRVEGNLVHAARDGFDVAADLSRFARPRCVVDQVHGLERGEQHEAENEQRAGKRGQNEQRQPPQRLRVGLCVRRSRRSVPPIDRGRTQHHPRAIGGNVGQLP